MIIKGPISFNRNLPPYVLKFNISLVCFFAAWAVLCIPAMIAVGVINGEEPITYIVMIALFSVFFIGLIIFYAVARYLRRYLIEDCTAEIEQRFADMPLEKAKENLIAAGIINESGFVYRDAVFGEMVLPFDKAAFAFGFFVRSTEIHLDIAIGSSEDKEVKAIYNLSGDLYNFLIKNNFDLSGNKVFDLLINDKKAFTETLLNGGKNLKKLIIN